MNVRQKLVSMLVCMGMFESQAEEVMDLAIPDLNNLVEDYNITFNSESSSYPSEIYKVLMMSIKPIALKWINENAPNAWFKPMFK